MIRFLVILFMLGYSFYTADTDRLVIDNDQTIEIASEDPGSDVSIGSFSGMTISEDKVIELGDEEAYIIDVTG